MKKHIERYQESLSQAAIERMGELLPAASYIDRVQKAMSFHFLDGGSKKFQEYYLGITANEAGFLTSRDFFKVFKTRYALQGIDGDYLNALENDKAAMLRDIQNDEMVLLYERHFAKANLTYKDRTVNKSLGSFFAKFIHTFRPAEYCALDGPIKNLLGLKGESFFMAFIAISAAYKEWVRNDPGRLLSMRKTVPAAYQAMAAKMTDIKILDLVFWHIANGANR